MEGFSQQIELPPEKVSAPALSRAFLSADDAARYAHEQVGKQRDHEYIGCIFKRDDQRFVVTEPRASGKGSMDGRQLYPVDGQGMPVFPDNHVLQGLFYSHVALSTLDAQKVYDLGWSPDDAALSLLMFSVAELRHILKGEEVAYLSGAEDSLIRFKPDRSLAKQFLDQLGTAVAPGKLASDLEAGVVKPGKLVREAVAAGDLQVVISNGRWWPRGKVTDAIIVGPWERSVPEQVSHGAIFGSADEAALDRYARGVEQHEDERTWFGFILKQQGKEEYIASELVPASGVRDKLYSLNSLYGLSDKTRERLYPESFVPHSYFYLRQRVKYVPNQAENWLAQHFIVPRDLFVVRYNSKRRPVVETDARIPLYVSTQDGALLKYVARKDSKLFDDDSELLSAVTIQDNLMSGKLSSTGFVRVVANSGELSIMRTSLCWDRRGVVDINWSPSASLQRRSLGPVFLTADDASLYARSQLPSDSTKKLYGGLILKRADGLFVATEPVGVIQEDFDTKWIFPDESVTYGQFPAGCSIVARYRSRVSRELPVLFSPTDKQVYLNMLSVNCVYTAFMRQAQHLDEYLFNPDGSVIRYRTGLWSRFKADLANALNDFKSLPHDLDGAWIKQRIHSWQLTPTAWVKSLVKTGSLQVIAGSRLWGQPGAVTTFEPYPVVATQSVYALAVADPAYSPVFAQEEDAARFVHEQAGNRAALSFGFILSHTRDGSYTANLPTEVQGSQLAYDRIFPGALPYRYIASGLYLCAAQIPQGLTDEDYRHFFSPMDMHLARTRAWTPQGFKPMYFSCADGALLKLALSAFDPVPSLDKFGQIQLRENPFASREQASSDWGDVGKGQFKLSSYVRRMAKAGKLEVLITSAYWSRLGEVGEDWQPRMPAVSAEQLWSHKQVLALGPIFQHSDDAACYAQRRAGSAYEQETVYESAILAKSSSHSYIALEPLANPNPSSDAVDLIFRTASNAPATKKPPKFPGGYSLMAGHQLYQSGNTTLATDIEEVYVNFSSPALLHAHTYQLKAKGFGITAYYYSTPHGALLKYTPAYTKDEEALLLTKTVQFVGGQWVTILSPGEFISRLMNIGELRVLKAAHYWNQTGRLGVNWRNTRLEKERLTLKRHDEL
ncbi:hypothetical protein J2W17_003980 [Pseudomonas lini]|uniref:hypothetical protein n=1 Tax=Pseudomonas lini TaxID=163011 RepID=UPI002783CF58|nr:hypothetical protein [Pseudomonas lini]MDQ0125024.1 hypothetical protein [Pseudomonas lini]